MTTGSDIAIALRAAYLALHCGRRRDSRRTALPLTSSCFWRPSRMSSDPSTVRAMLVLLEERGLVERATHPTDAHARTVALTEERRRTFQELWTAGEPIRAQMLGALKPNEAETLVGSPKHWTSNLDQSVERLLLSRKDNP